MYKSCILLEQVFISVPLIRPKLSPISCYNYIQESMHNGIASFIEGCQRFWIWLLFVILFNPYNIYAPFYSAPSYGNISICPYPGSWIGNLVRHLICIFFFCSVLLSYVLAIYSVYSFYFLVGSFFNYLKHTSPTRFSVRNKNGI